MNINSKAVPQSNNLVIDQASDSGTSFPTAPSKKAGVETQLRLMCQQFRQVRVLVGILGAVLATVLPAQAAGTGEVEAGFKSMFNGKDLTGWEGRPGWWYVEEGAITSQSTLQKPCTNAHYLMWRGAKPGDFDLRLEFRLIGGNSGIQFRSRELPDYDTFGYQADMEAGDQWTGCLFEHARGGVSMRGQKVVIEPDGKKQISSLGDPKALLQAVKQNDWNTYRVLARGNELRLEINGTVMCEAIDRQTGAAAKDGVIALQMHPGPPMKVQFRNLRIKQFDSESPKH